jgi:hypothetical protein
MNFFKILILAAIALFVCTGEPFAEESARETPAVSKQAKLDGCRAACQKIYRNCATRPNTDACDSTFLGCDLGCFACRGAANECDGKASDKTDAARCDATFLACLKEKVAARVKEPPVRFEGGDGRSEQTAVIVLGATNNFEGVAAESLWTRKAHPDWRKSEQALIRSGSHLFDRIGYQTPDGPQTIWFEISGFFGKLGLDSPLAPQTPK